MMGDRTEKAPLAPKQSVSLRFPNAEPGRDTGGVFDGNNKKSEPFSYLTRRDGFEPPIPQPPQDQIDEAARRTAEEGPDPKTNPKGSVARKAYDDCLHYCLPGVPDTWARMLLATITDTDTTGTGAVVV